jgi:hypothetical protein
LRLRSRSSFYLPLPRCCSLSRLRQHVPALCAFLLIETDLSESPIEPEPKAITDHLTDVLPCLCAWTAKRSLLLLLLVVPCRPSDRMRSKVAHGCTEGEGQSVVIEQWRVYLGCEEERQRRTEYLDGLYRLRTATGDRAATRRLPGERPSVSRRGRVKEPVKLAPRKPLRGGWIALETAWYVPASPLVHRGLSLAAEGEQISSLSERDSDFWCRALRIGAAVIHAEVAVSLLGVEPQKLRPNGVLAWTAEELLPVRVRLAPSPDTGSVLGAATDGAWKAGVTGGGRSEAH